MFSEELEAALEDGELTFTILKDMISDAVNEDDSEIEPAELIETVRKAYHDGIISEEEHEELMTYLAELDNE